MSDSGTPWLRHTSFPCPSPFPGSCSNWCPLSHWCHPTISSSVTPFFSCPQSFPASESIPMSWLFTSGGQSIGASASALIFPMNIQGWLPLVLSGLISLSPRDSQESSPAPQFESINSLALNLLYNNNKNKVFITMIIKAWIYGVSMNLNRQLC